MQTSAVEGEAVTIVGEKRLIEKSATNSVRSVSSEEIQNSASRSVSGMLDMQAGVNITNGRLSIRGSRAEEVAYTLDGASITDVINTGRDVSAIPEALAEISVESGGFGAHIGGANSWSGMSMDEKTGIVYNTVGFVSRREVFKNTIKSMVLV